MERDRQIDRQTGWQPGWQAGGQRDRNKDQRVELTIKFETKTQKKIFKVILYEIDFMKFVKFFNHTHQLLRNLDFVLCFIYVQICRF
jgi:hypothetical protein